MAAVVIADLAEPLRLKVGIWDALADGGSWGFSGNDVTITIGELEYSYALSGVTPMSRTIWPVGSGLRERPSML